MNVLVAEADAEERRRLSQLIAALGHDVVTPKSSTELREVLKNRTPNVAIVGVLESQYSDCVSELVSASAEAPVYIIATLSRWKPADIKFAWDIGADDIMRANSCPEEIVGRVSAIERIKRKYLDTDGSDAAADVQKMYVWRELDRIICQEFTDMLGQEFSIVPVADCPMLEVGAEVMLCLADSEREVKLGVGVEGAALDTFCEMLFGEAVVHDILTDALRELTNTAGGAFKREALIEKYTFSLGLPKDCSTPDGAVEHHWMLSSPDGMKIVFWGGFKSELPVRINARQLREGMVLTRDVRTHSGALLVSAGRVLTQRTCERLVELVGPATVLEVHTSAA